MVYGVTFFLIAIALSVPRMMRSDFKRHHIFKNIQQYGRYLARDIGVPPDLRKAKEMARGLRLAIRIEGPGVDFKTRNFRRASRGDLKRNGVKINQGSFTYVFRLARPRSTLMDVLLPIGLVIVILIFSYQMTLRIFRPLRDIELAAREMTKGKFDIVIENKGKGELYGLSLAMENMAKQLGDRFENLRQLLHGISHELRTPLTRMKLALEFIDNSKVTKSIADDIHQIDEITGQLLETERLRNNPGSLLREKILINEIIEDTFEILLPENNSYELKMEKVEAIVDPSRFKLLVRNLINNSKKYAEGQKIHLSLKSVNSREFKIVYRDDGPGFPQKVIDRFGQPFLRNEESHDKDSGGFGLGLSLCSSIVSAHGGSMIISNHPEGGALSEIVMPVDT